MENQETPTTYLNLATVNEIIATEKYSRLFSKSAIRHLIFNASEATNTRGAVIRAGNGLIEAGVIIRIGRRVFFDLTRFDQWILSQRVRGAK